MYTKDVSKYTIECGSVLKGGKIRIIRTHSSFISICEVRTKKYWVFGPELECEYIQEGASYCVETAGVGTILPSMV